MDEYTQKRIEREKNKKINEMIASELADEIIPEGDVEAARELCLEYGAKKLEYLVDGAILTCDRAIIAPIKAGEEQISFLSDPNAEERKETRLKVSEDATELNGGKAATVKDHVVETNIVPFECNCAIPLTKEEEQKILDDLEECNKHGTCRKLIKLDDDWENMIRDTNYFCFDYTNENGKKERVSGITMMSMLFCSHGGLITPKTSGQIYYTLYKNGQGKHVGYLAYGGNDIVDKSSEGFFRLYDGPTVEGDGDCYFFADIYNNLNAPPNGALQGFCGEASILNSYGNTTYGGQDLDTKKGTLKYNEIERYAIALGPKIQNPDFDTTQSEIDGLKMAYGTCVDVMIKLKGKIYYIPAIITDVKEHTGANGYFQTGVTFEEANREEPKEPTGSQGNIVEWYVERDSVYGNKSEGLGSFDRKGGLIIYRNEMMK